MSAKRHSYQKAAEKLRANILEGSFPPGGRLPTERELCHQLGVSRITVRLALDLLEEEKLIVRRQGSGTYVSDHPRQILPLGVDYAGSVREHAPNLSRQLLGKRWTKPSAVPWAIPFLGKTTGRLLSAERIDRSLTENLAWDHAIIPEAFADKLTRRELASLDFVERWKQRQNLSIAEIHQNISAVAANDIDHARLSVKVGAPILQAVETYVSTTKDVLAVFLSHYLPGRIELHSKFQWPAFEVKRRKPQVSGLHH